MGLLLGFDSSVCPAFTPAVFGGKRKYAEKEQCSRHSENWLFREKLQSNDTELGGQCVRLMQGSLR